MQPINIKPLTGLRFLAASWVVLFHYWPKLATPWVAPLVQKGYLGVELFFVLSGFILCHVYLDAFGERRFSYGGFLWARLARIYPLHLATLLGVGAMALAAGAAGYPVDKSVLAWSSLPANLTLTQAWGLAPEAGWNHPSWSISAEWFAYLNFPLCAGLAWSLRRRPYLATASALALLFGLYALFPRLAGFPLDEATIAWGALRIVPCFAYGAAIYLVWRSNLIATRAMAASGAVFFGALVVLVSALSAADVMIVTLFGPLILCLAGLTSTGSRLGSGAVFVYLGEISFAVYMVCIPWSLVFVNVMVRVLHTPNKQLPITAWVIMLIGVPALAAAAHHLVERPARAAMRAWADSWAARDDRRRGNILA
ncbi:MAG TPA: acyltransferase [Caulobacteraceae bacterium]|nr:acyltransferase [Caulobacteraceae bacterium]